MTFSDEDGYDLFDGFDIGYAKFMRMRINIARLVDKEFGHFYETVLEMHVGLGRYPKDIVSAYMRRIQNVEKQKNLDGDIVDFLFMSDCDGSISSETAGKLYDLIIQKQDSENAKYIPKEFVSILQMSVKEGKDIVWS
jgi:intergrase/recombinase